MERLQEKGMDPEEFMKSFHARWMRKAIREAEKNLTRNPSGGPFGACIVLRGRVLASARNTVLKNQDPTCHAEVNAIRLASKKLRSFDLSGCEIYSTTEPCPMCFAAIHWARIQAVHYGTTTRDAKHAGFNELMIEDRVLKKLGGSSVRLWKSPLAEECRSLFARWTSNPKRPSY